MDKETLRRHLTDEIQAEFDSKLRQAKRQKEQAEAELEAAEERWRAERRRLRSEIDRLEAALVDAKAGTPRKVDHKPQGLDPVAFAKLQEAADAKLKKAAVEWEAERSKLKSQINRLEGAVADALARASNPLRATQSVKQQFEAELNRVAKERTELEQAFLRARTEWEQEKLKMTGEMVKLRRAAQIMGRPVPKEDAREVNPKVRDLENQLQESLARWSVEREQLVLQIHKLEEVSRQWETERRQLNDHAGQLQTAFVQAQAQIQAYEVASRSPNPLEVQVEQLRREKETLERELQSRGRVSDEVVEQLRQQYEQRLHDAIQQKTQLATQLQSASSLLEAERARLSAAQAGGASGLDKDAIAAEISRVEALITEIVSVIDNPETELSTIIRKNVEKAELDAYLKGIRFSHGADKKK